MPLHPVARRSALLAALQFQYDWGAEDVVSDIPWNVLGNVPMSASENGRVTTDLERGLETLSPIQDMPAAVAVSQQTEEAGAVERAALARTATHRLEPVIVENAPFMLIGETPDADEDRSGFLFQGRAGDLLDRMLMSIGLTRTEISMAPAVPWRPPGGRTVTEAELRACIPILHQSIVACQPAFIVTVGATPIRMLLGERTLLSRVRGKWADLSVPGLANRIRVLPLNHPLQLAASPAVRRNVWQDLLVLAAELDDSKDGAREFPKS